MWLNLAEIAVDVTTLGPGRRIGVWTQGCPFRCPDCISPEWQPLRPNKLVRVEEIRDHLLSLACHDGLTFSGGEPMLQAAGLLSLWRQLRTERPDWTLIVFSGYRRQELVASGQPEQQALLADADAFVGGPYVAALNDGRGLRGSANQEIWFPPNTRFNANERQTIGDSRRRVELRLQHNQLLLIGVPQVGWRWPMSPQYGTTASEQGILSRRDERARPDSEIPWIATGSEQATS
jgi:anaerobic ribonucleoside-triphosphate reductase activating protein